jgi:hypothetical protein
MMTFPVAALNPVRKLAFPLVRGMMQNDVRHAEKLRVDQVATTVGRTIIDQHDFQIWHSRGADRPDKIHDRFSLVLTWDDGGDFHPDNALRWAFIARRCYRERRQVATLSVSGDARCWIARL